MSNSPLVSHTKLSPNCNKPRTKPILKITPHHMAGNLSVEVCGNMFASGARQASSNYGIGSDGRIALYVDEANRAWTSSRGANDHQAVTIEVANDGGAPDWHVSDKALAALIDLCVDICKRNNIPSLNFTGDANGNLTQHNYFAATACPGPYLNSQFPHIAAEVNKRLQKIEVPPVPTPPTQPPTESIKYPAVPFTVNVIVPDLNYRSTPSMNGTVKGQTGRGIFTVIQVENGWGKLKSGVGWIWLGDKAYCTVQSTVTETETDLPFRVRIEVTNLNIRKGPGINHGTNGQTGKGIFTIVEVSTGEGSIKGWGKLKSGAGWISLDLVTKTD